MPEAPARLSPRVSAKRRRRRAEILQAALQAFRERGYHATTLDDIANHLGLRKTALYHYFPDKEAILYACHLESLGELDRIMATARAQVAGPAERLGYVIREHVRVMTDTLQGSPLAFEVTALSPSHQTEIIRGRDAYEGALRALIEQGMRAGELRPVNPKLAAFAILGAVNWIARWYRPEGPLQTQELGVRFAEQLLGGLACSPRP
ncbi:MAG TPA: TetR/AcrR family transcriptional regulator [Gemmatimonadales bacterium]|nr:TetR/AcrR family transcriptional regulator [Gemmatimonadales bacterium]